MLRFKLVHLRRAGDAVRQPADARAHGPEGARRASAPHRAARAAAGVDARLRHAVGAAATSTWRSTRCTRCSRTRSRAIFRGEVENDDFNRLVVAARMPADEIVVLRAYAKYMRQIGFPLSQAFIEATLAAHAGIARMLVELFKARFDPDGGAGAGARAAEQERAIEAALERRREPVRGPRAAPVPGADPGDDAHELLAARRRRASGARFLSFKFDPSKVPGLPEPKPMFEIFVYSTRFEGVHLRGGTRRARRPALVGSARGLPHRGARPREGADGEEHRHRAGRLARAASC